MLKTCFGCCPLGYGVSGIGIINLVWNVLELLKHALLWYNDYYRSTKKVTMVDDYDSTTGKNYGDDWSLIKRIPTTTEIFMDYLFIITAGWIALEFVANFCLKQSTFKCAPQKVYAWLVIYYANLFFMVLHLVHYSILLMRYERLAKSLFTLLRHHFGHIFVKLAYTIILIVEITIVHSHYIFEEKQKLNDIVQLKWKYVARGKQLSKGVDFSSASTFNEMTSRQTQEGSRVPPYITNINQN